MADITLQQIAELLKESEKRTAQLVDERLAAQDVRTDAKFAELVTQIGQTMREVILSVDEQLERQKDEIVREVRMIAENTEGKSIRVLSEAVLGHSEQLREHEQRIDSLERVAL